MQTRAFAGRIPEGGRLARLARLVLRPSFAAIWRSTPREQYVCRLLFRVQIKSAYVKLTEVTVSAII